MLSSIGVNLKFKSRIIFAEEYEYFLVAVRAVSFVMRGFLPCSFPMIQNMRHAISLSVLPTFM